MAACTHPTTPPALIRKQQTEFLEALRLLGNITRAAKHVGAHPNAPWQWARHNRKFAEKMYEVKAAAEKAVVDAYECDFDELLLPDKPLTLDEFVRTQLSRMFRMKRLDPRYKDNASFQVAATGPVAIMIGLDGDKRDREKSTYYNISETQGSILRIAQVVDKTSENFK